MVETTRLHHCLNGPKIRSLGKDRKTEKERLRDNIGHDEFALRVQFLFRFDQQGGEENKQSALSAYAGVQMSGSKVNGITFLHISDFHFKSHERYDQDMILSGLMEKISELANGEWFPHLIFCTGDIVFSGKPEEYKVARGFFDELLGTTGITKDRLFVVPGNHDVDWDKPPRLTAAIEKDEDSDDFFLSRNTLNVFLEQFHGYQAFSSEYLRRPFDENNYAFANVIKINGFKVGIAGLNSAWLSTREKEHGQGKQLLGRLPLMKVLKELKGADLRIAMFHHPLHWLLNFEQHTVRILLERSVDLILHGHQDKPDMDIYHVGARRKVVFIQAGPAHGSKPWPNRIHLIRLEANETHVTTKVKVYPLKLDREVNKWVLDTAVFCDSVDYIGCFDLVEVSMLSRANLITQELGIRYNLYHSESDIKIDGSADITRTIDLEVLRGAVSSLDYHHFSRSTESYKITVSRILGNSSVSVNIVDDTPTNVRYSVDFTPPLKTSQRMVFQTKEKYLKSYPMTLDEIAEYIKTGKWTGEPYTYKSFLVNLPTEKLLLSALLPENYGITTAEEFFDVRVGYYGGSRHQEEYDRLGKTNSFSRDVITGKQVLKLNVDVPKIGLVYMIKWRPPTKRDYERLCKTS